MTSWDDTDNAPDRDDICAAEYVVGTLPAEERADVARRIESDPEFARIVEKWEKHFGPLTQDYDEVAPPASVKASIKETLFHQRKDAGRTAGFWRSLTLWRGLTAVSLALVALLAVFPILDETPVQPAPRFVASLQHKGSDVHYFVVYSATDNRVGLNHVSGPRPDGHDFVLWVSSGGKKPVSLGVIPKGEAVALSARDAAQVDISSGTVFMITLEPHGGPTPDGPSGPVVATGDLRKI